MGLGGGRTELVRAKHFVTELIEAAQFAAEPQACQLVLWIDGRGSVGGEEAKAGEVWLLPEETVVIEAEGRFLRTFVPQ